MKENYIFWDDDYLIDVLAKTYHRFANAKTYEEEKKPLDQYLELKNELLKRIKGE